MMTERNMQHYYQPEETDRASRHPGVDIKLCMINPK